jgi:hypothetical protein
MSGGGPRVRRPISFRCLKSALVTADDVLKLMRLNGIVQQISPQRAQKNWEDEECRLT